MEWSGAERSGVEWSGAGGLDGAGWDEGMRVAGLGPGVSHIAASRLEIALRSLCITLSTLAHSSCNSSPGSGQIPTLGGRGHERQPESPAREWLAGPRPHSGCWANETSRLARRRASLSKAASGAAPVRMTTPPWLQPVVHHSPRSNVPVRKNPPGEGKRGGNGGRFIRPE